MSSPGAAPLEPPRHDKSVLYHYTSLEGIEGIISSGEVRASVIHYLNDSQEFEYAVSLTKSLIEEREAQGNGASKRICNRLLGSLPNLKPVPVCVFSLSEHDDRLSQWRGYCRPGAGYAIGFRKRFFDWTLGRVGIRLVPCRYQENDQKLILNDFLNNLFESYRDEPENERLEAHFSAWLARVAPQIKHPDFEEEAEWRIFLEPNGRQLRYRVGNTMLIPFLGIGLEDGQFRERQ